MSVKIMHLVFERFNLPGNDKVLALALADHAHDDGTNIFPGNERLAAKTCMSERTVIRLLQKFVRIGWLIKTRNADSRRGLSAVYKISSDWINSHKLVTDLAGLDDNLSPENDGLLGDNLSPINNDVLGDKNEHWVTNRAVLGDIALSPQPSLTINTTIISTRAQDSADQKPTITPEAEYAIRLIELKVNATSMHPVVHKWVQDKIQLEFVVECVAVARIYKPLPEIISLGYLDSIVRNKMAEPTKPKVDNAWLHDDDALERKGREVGVLPKRGESWSDYRKRVKAAIESARQAA